jgi:hypothetical protein
MLALAAAGAAVMMVVVMVAMLVVVVVMVVVVMVMMTAGDVIVVDVHRIYLLGGIFLYYNIPKGQCQSIYFFRIIPRGRLRSGEKDDIICR